MIITGAQLQTSFRVLLLPRFHSVMRGDHPNVAIQPHRRNVSLGVSIGGGRGGLPPESPKKGGECKVCPIHWPNKGEGHCNAPSSPLKGNLRCAGLLLWHHVPLFSFFFFKPNVNTAYSLHFLLLNVSLALLVPIAALICTGKSCRMFHDKD